MISPEPGFISGHGRRFGLPVFGRNAGDAVEQQREDLRVRHSFGDDREVGLVVVLCPDERLDPMVPELGYGEMAALQRRRDEPDDHALHLAPPRDGLFCSGRFQSHSAGSR